MNRIIYVSVLAIANIIVYFTPFTRTGDANNFDLKSFSAIKDVGDWKLIKDIGATELEVKALPNSRLIRKIYKNGAGQEVTFVIVASNARSSVHSPTDCLPAQGWVIDRSTVVKNLFENDVVPVNSMLSHYDSGGRSARSLVWYWFAVHKNNFNRHFSAVIFNSINRVLYGKNYYWGLVRISTPLVSKDGIPESEALKDFAGKIYPLIKQVKDSE